MQVNDLLRILACPACHSDLRLLERGGTPEGFLCPHCNQVYPIEDNIPVMLLDQAIPYDTWVSTHPDSTH